MFTKRKESKLQDLINVLELQNERNRRNPTKFTVILNRRCRLFNIRKMYVHVHMNTKLHMQGRKVFMV
jgi:hypothetical protein